VSPDTQSGGLLFSTVHGRVKWPNSRPSQQASGQQSFTDVQRWWLSEWLSGLWKWLSKGGAQDCYPTAEEYLYNVPAIWYNTGVRTCTVSRVTDGCGGCAPVRMVRGASQEAFPALSPPLGFTSRAPQDEDSPRRNGVQHMPVSGSRLVRREAPIVLALTVEEAAAALRISRTRLYQAIRTGALASYCAGPRSRRISVRALEQYQAALEGMGGDAA
jgi:excisionase family DNA binding protein